MIIAVYILYTIQLYPADMIYSENREFLIITILATHNSEVNIFHA